MRYLCKTGSFTLAGFFALFFAFQSVQAASTADVLFVVDESGSMSGEHAWLSTMINSLDSGLISAEVTGNRYGLVGYGASRSHGIEGHKHSVGGSDFGTAAQFASATGDLVTSGSFEDGYDGINFALNNYSFRSDAALNVVLVTDEDRDIISSDNPLTFNGILADLTGRGALLNVVVRATFSGDGGPNALGVDSKQNAFFADAAGGFTTSAGGLAAGGTGSTIADYFDLALATGGAGWDLNQLRAGGNIATSFTNAFVNIKIGEIVSQLPVDPPAPSPVPVPATLPLFGFGLAGLSFFKRKFQKAA